MNVYAMGRRMAGFGVRRLGRQHLTYLGGISLFVVVGACSGRDKMQVQLESNTPTESSAAASTPAAAAKNKARTTLRDRPSALIYRQATEQARAHLTAENAHLRLDELDAQIESEKENTR